MLVRNLSQAQFGIRLTNHAQDQLTERGVSRPEINACLRSGRITEGPYRDLKTGDWKMNFDYRWDGTEVRVVVALDWDEELGQEFLNVVTVIDIGRKR